MDLRKKLSFNQKKELHLDYEYLINLIESGSRVFFTSDWHFSHKNIVKFEPEVRSHLINKNNDFNQSLNNEEINLMDSHLIAEWNNQIKEKDIVFYLGDFSFNNKNTQNIFESLNGNIIYIHGNHDKSIEDGLFDEYLLARYKYLEIRLPIFQYHDYIDLVLFHYPILEWNKMHHNAIHLYGHVHSTDLSNHWIGAESKRAINACYDFNHGKFLQLEDIYLNTKNLEKITRHK